MHITFNLIRVAPSMTEDQAKEQSLLMRKSYEALPDSLFLKIQQQTFKSQLVNNDLANKVANWQTDSERPIYLDGFQFMLGSDLRDEIKALECKVIVFCAWSPSSGISKKAFEGQIQNQFPSGFNVRIIEGNHFVFYEKPELVAEWISKNLEE